MICNSFPVDICFVHSDAYQAIFKDSTSDHGMPVF